MQDVKVKLKVTFPNTANNTLMCDKIMEKTTKVFQPGPDKAPLHRFSKSLWQHWRNQKTLLPKLFHHWVF